jgi:hypothetical protein
MKRIITAIAAVMFLYSVSSYGLNLKREACKKSCETAKDECYEKAKDKKGKTNDVKKAACDTTYSECIDRCNKQ